MQQVMKKFKEDGMKRKLVVGGLFISVLLLGACQKSNTVSTTKSTKQTSSIIKEFSNSSIADSTASYSSLENDIQDSSDSEQTIISKVQKQLIGKRVSMMPVLYDNEDVTQATEENNAPQNLIHDGATTFHFIDASTVHVELLGTYRPDYDTSYTLTDTMIIIQQWNIPYSVSDGGISFDNWTTESNGHTITWSFTPK